jgi:hypothetical protein
MLKSTHFLPLLVATYVLGISACVHPTALCNPIETPKSYEVVDYAIPTIVPGGERVIVTITKNTTVTTCPEHKATPSSLSSTPVSTRTPCNVLTSSVSSSPTPTAVQTSNTVYMTTYITMSSYICATGWTTSTYTITMMKTKTCTDQPLATPDTLTATLPTSTIASIIYNTITITTTTTPASSATLPCASNHTTTQKFQPYPTVASPSGYEESNAGSKHVILEAAGMVGIGFVAWLMIQL